MVKCLVTAYVYKINNQTPIPITIGIGIIPFGFYPITAANKLKVHLKALILLTNIQLP